MIRGDKSEKAYTLIGTPTDIELIGLMNSQPSLIKELTFKTRTTPAVTLTKYFGWL